MVKKIEWTKTSLVDLSQILIYLRDEVSENASIKFAGLVKLKISQLADNNFEGRSIPNRKSIRFILLGKYHRLYYRRHGNILYVTRFYDTRQNPNKQPY